MGGSYEEKVDGLRFHLNGDVHFHDDARGLKFTAKPDDFREQVEEALEILDDEDGLVKINGTSKEKLCIIREGGTLAAVILEKNGIKQKLRNFIKHL